MNAIQRAIDILRQAISAGRVREHVLDDVEIALEHLEDAAREFNNTGA